MAKRRKLPAPPLVLTPYLARFPRHTEKAGMLLQLAEFLKKTGLLTDGGEKSFERGLEGRNGMLSLTLQDVRSWAHGYVQEVVKADAWLEENWQERLGSYFLKYDRGKPRRPTHLQRLYLKWSRDHSWRGLLRALCDHPHLAEEISLALERLDDSNQDKFLLNLALSSRRDPAPWVESFEGSEAEDRIHLLELLPHLSREIPKWRVPYLASRVESQGWERAEPWTLSLLRACRCTAQQARELRRFTFQREVLENLALQCLNQECVDPVFVCSFRSFVTSRVSVELLLESIRPDDPLHRIAFGPRPGRNWLAAMENELLKLTELR